MASSEINVGILVRREIRNSEIGLAPTRKEYCLILKTTKKYHTTIVIGDSNTTIDQGQVEGAYFIEIIYTLLANKEGYSF